jgi:hypothetical protein
MTRFFSLSTATLRLRPTCTSVSSTALLLSVVLGILILVTLSVLRSSGFVSHA